MIPPENGLRGLLRYARTVPDDGKEQPWDDAKDHRPKGGESDHKGNRRKPVALSSVDDGTVIATRFYSLVPKEGVAASASRLDMRRLGQTT